MKHVQPKTLHLGIIAPLDYNALIGSTDEHFRPAQPDVAEHSFFANCVGAISLRRALAVAAAVLAFLAAWIWATFQFPETTRMVRLVLLLIATGGPND